MNEEQVKAWYKQFWPWFLIALPGSVVIASIATIILAVSHPDSVVVDDYYKAGLAINRDLSREQLAMQLDIKSQMHISDHQVKLTINASRGELPSRLLLRFMHPTLPDRDQAILLKPTDTMTFSGEIATLANGTWNVSIESEAPAWRIQRRIDIDGNKDNYILR